MSSDELHILILAGTTRKQRKSIHAAEYLAAFGNAIDGVKTTLVDPAELNLPGDGNDPEGKDPKYTKLTEEADGFFIVVPEYNHSFPGSLKRMLDSELANYIHKPVALAGVSAGMFGGVRAVESLVPPVREMGMTVTFTDIYFSHSYEMFDDEGNIVADKKELYDGMAQKAFDELIWMAKTLKHGREHIK